MRVALGTARVLGNVVWTWPARAWAQLGVGLAAVHLQRACLLLPGCWLACFVALALRHTLHEQPLQWALSVLAPRYAAGTEAMPWLAHVARWPLAEVAFDAPVWLPPWMLTLVLVYSALVLGAWTGWGPVYGAWAGSRLVARRGPTSHGSAAWGTRAEAEAAGMLEQDGAPPKLLLGAYGPSMGQGRARYQVDTHVLTCASTGSGKGIGAVIYNLLTYPGSTFVLDIKGENYAVTAHARLRLGQRVACIDPFQLAKKPSHRVDWLANIDPTSPEGVSDATVLADSLIVSRTSGDTHWDDSAAYLIQGLILYAASCTGPERSMATVRRLLTDGAELDKTLQTLAAQAAPEAEGMARVARTYLAKEERERSSVLSTAVRHTRFLDDPRLLDTLNADDFALSELKDGPLTLYLMIPPDKLAACRSYIRAFVGLALRAMVRHTQRPAHSVLFLLDEFAQLGRFRPVEEAIAILRGYHVRLWVLLQDLSQLRAHYPEWETFIANCSLQFFGVQDQKTANYVSAMLGKKTQKSAHQGRSHSARGDGLGSETTSTSWCARSLMTPDEVCLLPKDEVIVRVVSQRPQRLRRLNYLKDREVRGHAHSNPMY